VSASTVCQARHGYRSLLEGRACPRAAAAYSKATRVRRWPLGHPW
jgi:hypothetical protein